MPRTEGIFRQRRQSYNTKSVLRLDERVDQEEGSNDQISSIQSSRSRRSSIFRRTVNRISNEVSKDDSKLGSRNVFRRMKRRFIKRLRDDVMVVDRSALTVDPNSLLNCVRRTKSKTDLSIKGVPSRSNSPVSITDLHSRSEAKGKHLQKNLISTSSAKPNLFSGNGERKHHFQESLFSLESTKPPSDHDQLGKKLIETNSSWISTDVQTLAYLRNASTMVMPEKPAEEKETQKSEIVLIKTMEDKTTQMLDYFTVSDLHCIDWMHRNLVDIKLNPFHVLKDERIREPSEITSYTSEC